ncbi:EF-hand calcium-binding domain-containing protein 6-like [Watersipora subatra]|uniref:EF-hand calcium-binding domain-containing protein 6-like n=1 Tax=Watersipora subatra TaxID=2589382 RepID=UPI00355C2BF1
MSRVGVASRPATQQSGGRLPVLPAIQHPMSAMAPGPAQIDVVGGNAPLSASGSRPLAAEQDYKIPKRLSTAGSNRMGYERYREPTPHRIEMIPEGVQVTEGDPSKTRMPIFGNRSQIGSRDDVMSRVSSRLSQASTQSRLEIDELESIIKEKCRTHFHEVQKKFKDNDPQGQGNVNKEALYRIVTMMTGRNVSQQLYQQMLHRIGLHDKNIIHFAEFFSKFRILPSSAYPQWMTSINKNFNDRPVLNAVQVHSLLREKARQRVLDVADLVPQMNPGGASRLLKPEFKNALNKLMFSMDDDEFERLWQKYDDENIGVIDGSKFMKKLGISLADAKASSTGNVELPVMLSQEAVSPTPPAEGSPRKKETARQRSIDIERWLKNKFREGFHGMKTAFEDTDTNKSGLVPAQVFCSTLANHGLKLERNHLDEFLARCGLSQLKTGVPYKEFLHRFQDRSEEGMPHKILGDPGHRYNKSVRSGSPGAQSALSAIEAQLMNMFQKDFLSLIGTFHKIDRLGTDVISQEEFRAAIESRFNVEMSDEQFRVLIDNIPITNEGDVKYAEFMAQFDTRGDTQSLFTTTGSPKHAPIKADGNGNNVLVLDDDGHDQRSTEQLQLIIKDIFNKQYKNVEKYFSEMEEFNSQRLSQETLYKLLKRFNISPVINRGEIRQLWKTFITNKDNKLEWLQFVRTFGHSPSSAAFPNAKLKPPVKGDADFSKRSKILNSDMDLLADSLRSKIDFMWDDLRKEFFAMDPYGTGHISRDEFREVLCELCVHLTEAELNEIMTKFTSADGRVSYIEFLRPFAMKRDVWKHGNDMNDLLAHPRRELPIADIGEPPQKGLVGISSKLRQKLAGDWKNLRRAFKKLDKTGNGLLTLPEFRNVLKLANVVLDEDEVYNVMHTFDEELSGRIDYNKFLSETFRPESKASRK